MYYKNNHVAISIILCLALFFVSCSGDYHGKPNEDFHKKPVQVLNDITLHRSKDGQVIAILKAPTVEAYAGQEAKTVFPKGIEVTFLNDDLSDKAILTAKYAISYDTSDLVHIKDSVKILSLTSKDTIYCIDLFWDQRHHQIFSHKPIKRFSSSGEDYGDGITANEVFDSITILNPHGKQQFNEN